jgi:hypothetical protein
MIVMHEWSGNRELADVKGPILLIRHPRWVEETPRQDIPVMIFSHSQWSLLEDGRLTVSAAPYDPDEIGRNRTYVFALPPRYINDAEDGYEEVVKIMDEHPFRAFYSGFDSGLYRILDAKWHFSQENATLHHLQITTFESKPL